MPPREQAQATVAQPRPPCRCAAAWRRCPPRPPPPPAREERGIPREKGPGAHTRAGGMPHQTRRAATVAPCWAGAPGAGVRLLVRHAAPGHWALAHTHLLVEDAEEVDSSGGPHPTLGTGLGLVREVALRGWGGGGRWGRGWHAKRPSVGVWADSARGRWIFWATSAAILEILPA